MEILPHMRIMEGFSKQVVFELGLRKTKQTRFSSWEEKGPFQFERISWILELGKSGLTEAKWPGEEAKEDFSGGPVVKNLPAMQETQVQPLVWEDSTCYGTTKPKYYNQRRPVLSNEDPAQPKVDIFFKSHGVGRRKRRNWSGRDCRVNYMELHHRAYIMTAVWWLSS